MGARCTGTHYTAIMPTRPVLPMARLGGQCAPWIKIGSTRRGSVVKSVACASQSLTSEQKRAETDVTNDYTAATDLDYADKLWKSADTLRGQVDAAEYKHVVLGLLFLKYISDSFEARRNELSGELEADGISGAQLERLLESRDEYTAERVFWVPPEARWAKPAESGDAPRHRHPHRRRHPRR